MITEDPTSLADVHSHLVPGVDDGAQTLEDTLRSVALFTRAGVRKIITTPHLDGSVTVDPAAFQERMDELDAGWEEARRGVAERFPEVDFRRGNEVMLDIPDPDLSDMRLHLGDTSFVLLEWPRLQIPPGTPRVIQRIVGQDVRPIIAHPERYAGMDPQLQLVEQWRALGARIQVNYGSLVGRYGPAARNTARRLLRRGWVDYLSSDFHGREHLKLYLNEARGDLEGTGAEEQWHMLTLTNPARIFDGEDPLPVPALPVERGFWGRIKNMLSPQ